MKLFESRKGNAFAWLSAMGALVFLAIMYLVFTQVWNAFDNNLPRDDFTSEQNDTWTMLDTSWQWWPGLLLFGIIIYAINNTLRTDRYGGQG